MTTLESEKAYFTSTEVRKMLNITKSELLTILRPVRSKTGLEAPIFKPESNLNQIVGNRIVFTQRDIIRMSRYFQALKEYKAAREALRTESGVADKNWMK